MTMIKNFLKDESGATAIEYGLLAALISVAGIAAFRTLGTNISDMFDTVSGELNNNGAGG